MSLSRLGDCLDQMLTAANDARRFIDGMSKEDFLADKRTQQAVVMSLVIVGEAAARIMERPPPGSWTSMAEFIASNPEIPWRGMRGMRNRVAHGYFDVTSMCLGHNSSRSSGFGAAAEASSPVNHCDKDTIPRAVGSVSPSQRQGEILNR